MAPVKRLNLHHHSADYIFQSFGITGSICRHFENRVLPKPANARGRVSVAHFISSHEENMLNRICYFHFLVYFLFSKDLTIENF